MKPLPIFIGFDPRQISAFHVLAHSICSRSSRPVSIAPLALKQLPINRPKEGSTEFSFSRFLVPYLSGYQGWSLYLDCDMLMRDDVVKLFDEARKYDATVNNQKAVLVVKHDHRPKEATKFLGEKQTTYEKKNWSSVMLFNNPLCITLTPNYVNTAKGLDLHQFKWLGADNLIGELPPSWNHLVGVSKAQEAKLLHWTNVGPWFDSGVEYSVEWRKELAKATA